MTSIVEGVTGVGGDDVGGSSGGSSVSFSVSSRLELRR